MDTIWSSDFGVIYVHFVMFCSLANLIRINWFFTPALLLNNTIYAQWERRKKNNRSSLIFFFSACQTIYDNCWILISPWCLIRCSQIWFHALGDWTASLSVGVKTWHWVTALPTLWTKRPNPSKVIETVKMSTVLLTKISLITRFTCQHYFGVIQSGLLWCLYGVVIYTSGSKVGWFFFSNTARLS